MFFLSLGTPMQINKADLVPDLIWGQVGQQTLPPQAWLKLMELCWLRAAGQSLRVQAEEGPAFTMQRTRMAGCLPTTFTAPPSSADVASSLWPPGLRGSGFEQELFLEGQDPSLGCLKMHPNAANILVFSLQEKHLLFIYLFSFFLQTLNSGDNEKKCWAPFAHSGLEWQSACTGDL